MVLLRTSAGALRAFLAVLSLLALSAFGLGAAQAHTRSESLSLWTVEGHEVGVAVTVPELEALRLSPQAPTDAVVAAYIGRHLSVRAGGEPCAPVGAAAPRAASRGFRRVEAQWRCAPAGDIEIASSAFYDLVPTHVMLARVQAGGSYSEQVLSADKRSLLLAGGHSLESAGFLAYIGMGLAHIVTGPDHIAFLLGLVLISGSWRSLALVVTGFTLGHSATLALAVTGWLRPAPELIDVLIALTIGLIGAENVALSARGGGEAGASNARARSVALAAGALLLAMAAARLAGLGRVPLPVLLGVALFAPCYLLLATRLADAAPLRAAVTAVFGLIHGFAFANDLIELQLPTGRLATLLFGFNLGVELGQLTIVALLLGAAALLVRLKLALPRALAVETVSAGLVGLSVFWLVGRTYASA